MSYLSFIGDFFISEWIWSFTFGLYHIPINIVLMFLISKCFVRINTIPAVLLIFCANVFSFLLLAGLVIGVFVYAFGFTYFPTDEPQVYTALQISLSLGLTYAAMQSLFFWVIHGWYGLRTIQFIFLSVLSNCLSSLLVYSLLPTY